MADKLLTQDDIFDLSDDDRYEGWGYPSEREAGHRAGQEERVAAADALVLAYFNGSGLDYEALFAWANSKQGRWFGDEAINGLARGRVLAELLPRV